MLLKLTGSLMVIAASCFLGFFLSKDLSKRPSELRTLQGLLQMLENEMCFLSNLLADSFDKIIKSSDSIVTVFFKDTINYLKTNEGLNASKAWELAVRSNINRTSLKKEDEEIIVSFGKLLGASDLEGQVKNIRLTLNQLKMQEQKAEESKKKNESMYKSLGILSGLAIVIILI
jgi:stage III sporulation protein AB